MKLYYLIFYFLTLVACKNYQEKHSFKKEEVLHLMQLIKENKATIPSLVIADRLQTACDRVLLLSKDIESPSAACEIGNAVFIAYADSIGLDEDAILLMNTKMDKAMVSEIILSNQLQLLNVLIAKQAPSIMIAPASAKD